MSQHVAHRHSDEINQLRAEVERLKAYASHERSLGAEGPLIELVSARQEIERLRATLREVSVLLDGTTAQNVADKARAALEKKP
jgi:uncharacterized small protein (DUF1192 family)